MNKDTNETAALELLSDLVAHDFKLALYACGGMTDSQRIAFEAELDEDPELCQELIELLERRGLPYDMVESQPQESQPRRALRSEKVMEWLLRSLNDFNLLPASEPSFADSPAARQPKPPRLSECGSIIVEERDENQDIVYTVTCNDDLQEDISLRATGTLKNGEPWERKVILRKLDETCSYAQLRVSREQRALFGSPIKFTLNLEVIRDGIERCE